MRYAKDNNLWKTSIQYTYLNGTWQRIRDVSGNVNGVWKSTIPPIGTFIEGGYVAGIIDTLASGGERYIVLVSPKEYQTVFSWTNDSSGRGPTDLSKWNGLANTVTTANTNYPATNYCANLVSSDGYADWYLPAVDELELCYRNLKPSRLVNDASPSLIYTVPQQINGYNPSSDPVGAGYTNGPTDPPDDGSIYWVTNPYRVLLSGSPMTTPVVIFQEGQSQSFWPPRGQTSNNPSYWTSTTVSYYPMSILFYTPQCGNYTTRSGKQLRGSYNTKSTYVRPIRRVII